MSDTVAVLQMLHSLPHYVLADMHRWLATAGQKCQPVSFTDVSIDLSSPGYFQLPHVV